MVMDSSDSEKKNVSKNVDLKNNKRSVKYAVSDSDSDKD